MKKEMMKQVKGLVIIAVMFFSLTSYKKAAPSIYGYWEIFMTVKDGKTENDRDMAMVFNTDGKLELISLNSGETLDGNWKLTKKGKSVKITFENKQADHGSFQIKSLTYDQMTLEKNGNQVCFDRGLNVREEK